MLRTIRAKFLGVAAFFVVWLVVATGFSVIQSLGINGDLEAVSRYVTPVKDALSDVRARQLEQISLLDRYMRVVENDGPNAPLEKLRRDGRCRELRQPGVDVFVHGRCPFSNTHFGSERKAALFAV